MGQEALVAVQFSEGEQLIDRLLKEGVTVTAAAWIKKSDGGLWYLYIASSLVGEDGARGNGYRRIIALVREMQKDGVWIDPMDIMLIGPDEPIAKALRAVPRRKTAQGLTWFSGPRLGELEVEQAIIYEL